MAENVFSSFLKDPQVGTSDMLGGSDVRRAQMDAMPRMQGNAILEGPS